jgi:hypothetical protein
MQPLEDRYSKELQQEKFAALVAARVNDIRSGTAHQLNFGNELSLAEETLLFADTVARAVCHCLEQE